MPSSSFGRYGVIGFELAGSIGAGFFGGRAVDEHFHTNGTALWIGFFLGVFGGFMLLAQAARGLEREAAKDEAEESRATEASRLERRLEQVEHDAADEATKAGKRRQP